MMLEKFVGAGVPAGVASADVDTLGHAFVLIPTHEDVADASASLAQPVLKKFHLPLGP